MARITANFIISADGKISTRGRFGSGFGAPADHARLLELRAGADAVLVGLATLEADGMTLGLGDRTDLVEKRRAAGKSPFPARVIACGSRTPKPDHPVFHKPGGDIHLLEGHDFLPALQDLARRHNWQVIHCEGGPRLFTALLEADLIDILFLTITARLFGGHSAPALLPRAANWTHSRAWSLKSIESTEGDLFLCYARA